DLSADWPSIYATHSRPGDPTVAEKTTYCCQIVSIQLPSEVTAEEQAAFASQELPIAQRPWKFGSARPSLSCLGGGASLERAAEIQPALQPESLSCFRLSWCAHPREDLELSPPRRRCLQTP